MFGIHGDKGNGGHILHLLWHSTAIHASQSSEQDIEARCTTLCVYAKRMTPEVTEA